MAKPQIFGPGLGFTMWSPPTRGVRSGIVQLGRMVAGPSFLRDEPLERLTREDQLPRFLARRIEVTALKMMFSSAQLFVEGHWHAPLVVEGAEVQRGRGNATRRSEGSKVFIAGNEAAHFGYGTVKRQGEALSVSAARQVITWQRTSGHPEGDPRRAFAANGALAGLGLRCDASTFLEPGFMNQSDGLQERPKQEMLGLFAPRLVPASAEHLEVLMLATTLQVAERLMQDREAVLLPLENRLGTWKRDPGSSIYLLDPMDADPGNKLFLGSEANYLEAVRDLYRNPASGLHQRVEELIRSAPALAHEVAGLADAGREERVSDPSYEPTPPATGGE